MPRVAARTYRSGARGSLALAILCAILLHLVHAASPHAAYDALASVICGSSGQSTNGDDSTPASDHDDCASACILAHLGCPPGSFHLVPEQVSYDAGRLPFAAESPPPDFHSDALRIRGPPGSPRNSLI